MIQDDLVQQGMSPNEAQVYQVLVRYGKNLASGVAKLTDISRTMVYPLLDNLVKKGFVEKVVENGKTYYRAQNPNIFVHKAKAQMFKAQELFKDLSNIQIIKTMHRVRTFNGLDGLRAMADIFLEEAAEMGGTMLQLGEETYLVQNYPEFVEEFRTTRTSKGIPLKFICNKFEGYENWLQPESDSRYKRQVKFVEQGELDVNCSTYIHGDLLAFFAFGDEMQGYIMKSENMSGLHKQLFELLWNKL